MEGKGGNERETPCDAKCRRGEDEIETQGRGKKEPIKSNPPLKETSSSFVW